jgi:single-strand DNA-binding protein
MAQDINVVVVTGRLADDAVLKQTPSGQSVMNIRLVNNRGKRKQGDQWVEQPPNYLNVTVWGRIAESLKPYLVKGKMIAVDGRLQQRSYQVQGEPKKRYVVDIVADNIELLGGAPSGARPGGGQSYGAAPGPASPASSADVPPEFGGAPDEGTANAGSDPFDAGAAPAPDDEIPF